MIDINKYFGDEYKLEKAFRVQHFDGDIRYAYAETEEGFLHVNPLYPFIGCNNPPAYILRKPQWVRIIINPDKGA